MVSTQTEGLSNLIDALCGRLPTTVPVSLPNAQPLRRPGILNEIVRDRGVDGGDDTTNETTRLTEALMNVMHADGPVTSSSQGTTPSQVHFKESLGMLSPLIVEYDEVTARQYERIVEQEKELDVMRKQLVKAKTQVHTMLENFADIQESKSKGNNADYPELTQQVMSYGQDNELLRAQVNVMANELVELNAELKARQKHCQNLERDLGEAKAMNGLHKGHMRADDAHIVQQQQNDDSNSRAHTQEQHITRLERQMNDLRRRFDSATHELQTSQSYCDSLEGTLRNYQQQSLEVYKQVKGAVQATERATIQRDQSFTREKALSDEVVELKSRLEKNTEKIDGHVMAISRQRNLTLGDAVKSAKHTLETTTRENTQLKFNLTRAKEEIERLGKARNRTGLSSSSDFIAETKETESVSKTLSQITNIDTSADEQRLLLRQKAHDESTKQRLAHAEESLLKQQQVTAEMEANAAHTIQILSEKLRRARRNELRKK
tara:strand:- start:48219 stop:49694 length:1476 start_codon:yes stop_codon:yes gene_type:complete